MYIRRDGVVNGNAQEYLLNFSIIVEFQSRKALQQPSYPGMYKREPDLSLIWASA